MVSRLTATSAPLRASTAWRTSGLIGGASLDVGRYRSTYVDRVGSSGGFDGEVFVGAGQNLEGAIVVWSE